MLSISSNLAIPFSATTLQTSLGLSLGLRCSEIDGEASLRKSLLILKAGNVNMNVEASCSNGMLGVLVLCLSVMFYMVMILGWQKNMEEVGSMLVSLLHNYMLLNKTIKGTFVLLNMILGWQKNMEEVDSLQDLLLALARFVFTRGESKVRDCYRLLVHMKSLWMMVVHKTWPIPVIKVAVIKSCPKGYETPEVGYKNGRKKGTIDAELECARCDGIQLRLLPEPGFYPDAESLTGLLEDYSLL
ncbi:hypothetical protein R6Q59_014130 [Mikania micrantha]